MGVEDLLGVAAHGDLGGGEHHLDLGVGEVLQVVTDAVKDLGFAEGTAVKALVKSTEVSLATGPVEGISIRNQIAGTVTDVATGGAMGSVKVSVEGGELTAAITKDAVEALGLAAGTSVVALIKSTEISLSV
ncbi:TOBE domain-containing protein [Streptomyces sp. NPDC003952]